MQSLLGFYSDVNKHGESDAVDQSHHHRLAFQECCLSHPYRLLPRHYHQIEHRFDLLLLQSLLYLQQGCDNNLDEFH